MVWCSGGNGYVLCCDQVECRSARCRYALLFFVAFYTGKGRYFEYFTPRSHYHPSPSPNPNTLFTLPTPLRANLLPRPLCCAAAPAPSSPSALLGGHSPSFFQPITHARTISARLIGTVGLNPCTTTFE